MIGATRRLVILDRDGVINVDRDDYVRSVAQWQPIDGSIDAIAALHQAGFLIGVATNQSGIGRGYYTRDTLYGMHRKMRRLVARAGGRIDAIAYCPDLPNSGSVCRKPAPGMLLQLADKLNRTLPEAIMVGDSERDLEAGAAVGCELFLVRTGKGRDTERRLAATPTSWSANVTVCDDLAEVAQRLLSSS
ncbi:MAG: D-glycero-beta-D-manno-heptose 1,7-bisphosphate 7-phosphatase [Pseudomonadota bacterium]